jgi:hypothetical protein
MFTIHDVAAAFGLPRYRIDKLLSARAFPTDKSPENGRQRSWSVADAVRLAIVLDLADGGAGSLGDSLAQIATDNLETGQFLVVHKMAMPLSDATKAGVGRGAVTVSGIWTSELVSADGLSDFLKSRRIESAHVVDVAAIAARVRAALEAAGGEK